MRKVLLVEPNYPNKYPPIGLMKISTYHKLLGDKVNFFKGNVQELINKPKIQKCFDCLKRKYPNIHWTAKKEILEKYFRTRRKIHLVVLLRNLKLNKAKKDKIKEIVHYFAYQYKPEPIYDRIYVTTLFTFYWNITIKTINTLKPLVKNIKHFYVGGIMASLLSKEVEESTGIKPHYGLLDKPGILDKNNDYIVDELTLDYSILDEIEYVYPTGSAYITFMTKGCTRKCPFCSVPRLEPVYKSKISAIDKFDEIKKLYGEQRNLLLMDNNVLASPRFTEIIEEIKEMGFGKGAKFVLPKPLEIAVRNLKNNVNNKAYIKKCFKLIHEMLSKLKDKDKKVYKRILEKYGLLRFEKANKSNIILAYRELAPIYSSCWGKRIVSRYVDFNQGIDGRYINEENISLLSQINVKPLRIAFDFIGMKQQYIRAVELAAKYRLKYLSNYLLYNFMDPPEDLYERLKINVDLNKKHNLQIFSFPMKYIPMTGKEAKHRRFVGPKWNRKFIRAVQCILNATKGIVAPGHKFFDVAFGKNVDEFKEILYMPETFILYRNKFKKAGLTSAWRKTFYSLNQEELNEAKTIIEKNDFENINLLTKNSDVLKLLSFYTITEKDLQGMDMEIKKLKEKFRKLAKENMFVNLTLTYEYT